MAKKPSNKTPKMPRPTKKTADAIAFFKGKKSAVDLLETEDRRKTRKLKVTPHVDTLNDKFFNAIEGKGKYIALALTVAATSYAVYWMMAQ